MNSGYEFGHFEYFLVIDIWASFNYNEVCQIQAFRKRRTKLWIVQT